MSVESCPPSSGIRNDGNPMPTHARPARFPARNALQVAAPTSAWARRRGHHATSAPATSFLASLWVDASARLSDPERVVQQNCLSSALMRRDEDSRACTALKVRTDASLTHRASATYRGAFLWDWFAWLSAASQCGLPRPAARWTRAGCGLRSAVRVPSDLSRLPAPAAWGCGALPPTQRRRRWGSAIATATLC